MLPDSNPPQQPTAQSPLPAIRLVERWAGEVTELHAQGMIHGNLHIDSGQAADDVSPVPTGSACMLGPGALCEWTPLPLREMGSIRLAREIGAASNQLQRLRVAFDPRQIDVFQLGAVLCRLLTGQSADAYLRSPKVKAQVQPELQAILERALITNRPDSFADVASLRSELARVAQSIVSASPNTSPAPTVPSEAREPTEP